MQTNLNGAGQSSASSSAILAGGDGAQLADMFTKLLVAQIQNQDPLSPTDPSQFVSQLTQLSQVEAMHKMASQSGTGNGMLQNLQLLALGGQVGSNLLVQTDRLELVDKPVSGVVNLANPSSKLTLTLTGADGVAHPLLLGAQGSGTVSFELDPAALGLPPGSYTLSAQADSGERPAVEIAGVLQSVRLGSNGSAMLSVSGVGNIDASAVTQFNGRAATSAS